MSHDQIEAAMQKEIEQLDWMSEATKKQAVLKLHAVRNKIGYPDKWRDYSSLSISPDDYFGNVVRSRVFEEKRDWAKVGKAVDRGEWDMTPPTVNAYYNDSMNDINFPAGVLQPPLYDPKEDDAPNYGNTGGTIGHELTRMASTIRAVSSTRRAISRTGGLRKTPKASRSALPANAISTPNT